LIELEHPDRAVPDDGPRLGDDLGQLLGGFGSDVEDHVVFGDIGDVLGDGRLVLVELLAADHVDRDRDARAARRHLLHQRLGRGNQVMLAERLADRIPGCGEEGVGDTAADHELIDLLGQGLQHGQLGRDLGSADDGDHRARRSGECLLERIELLGEQQSRAGDRRLLADAVRGCLGAMGGAEGVHDEDVAERGVLLGKVRVVFAFALVEADVLQQHQLAVGDLGCLLEIITHHPNLAAELRTHGIRDGLERVGLGEDAFLGAT
jgi:hypothetical protein